MENFHTLIAGKYALQSIYRSANLPLPGEFFPLWLVRILGTISTASPSNISTNSSILFSAHLFSTALQYYFSI